MIDRARQKQRELPGQVAQRAQFIVADVLALDLPIRFPLVIIPFYTLNLIKGRRRRADVLKILFRHMSPGAQLVIHCIPVERLKRQRESAAMSETPDVTVSFDNGTRLELLWGVRMVDAQALGTKQAVVYRHRQDDGTLIDESQEDLDFSWITDQEIAVSARQAGLTLSETLTSFIPGEGGNERIYILRRPGD